MKPRDRAAAALAVAVVERDHDGGAVVAVDQARRDDPDDAGVPFLTAEHDRAAPVAVELLPGHQLDRLLKNLPFDGLPRPVLLFEVGGDLRRLALVLGGE